MSNRPNWVLTNVAWELRVDVWMRMAVGDNDSRIGQWLDLGHSSHHHHLDRDTIRKIRMELGNVPDELAKTLPREVLEYRDQLREIDGSQIDGPSVITVTAGDDRRKAEADQIAHIERIQAKTRLYVDRLLDLRLTHWDAGTEEVEEFVSATASLSSLQVDLLGDSAWPMMVGHMTNDTSSLIDDHARALIDIVPDLGLSLEEGPGTKVEEVVWVRILKAYWDTLQPLWDIASASNLDPESDGWPWGQPNCRWCEPVV